MSINEDLVVVQETLANMRMLKKKYPDFTCEQLCDVLTINEKYGIPIEDIYVCYGYKMKVKYGSFDFVICHGYNLTNSKTHYKQNKNDWYIRFSSGGIGRFNFIQDWGGGSLFSDEVNDLYDKFIEKIKGYNPVDYDSLNAEYLFTVEDGYRLYKDFEKIFEETRSLINNELKNIKIKQLKSELENLERTNE